MKTAVGGRSKEDRSKVQRNQSRKKYWFLQMINTKQGLPVTYISVCYEMDTWVESVEQRHVVPVKTLYSV